MRLSAPYDLKDDADEPLEETPGGFAGVDGADLTPIKLSFGPLLAQLPGKLKLSATKGGNHIRLWRDAQRGEQVHLPTVWQNPNQMPATLYVEGITPSANVRDVELTLEYDEVPEGTPQNKQYLFKCSDKIALTVVKANIDGEYNRDGIPCDHECESAKVDFLHAKGMVIVANDDDDAGDQRHDNDGDLQPGEYEIQLPDGNSGIIDGASDLRKLIIPDPISYALLEKMSEILVEIGYGSGEAQFIMTTSPDGGPHTFGGEVHCASNTRRELK